MAQTTIKKQCSVAERLEIVNYYDKYGAKQTLDTYPCICKSTLYNWLARRKIPNKTLAPDSRKPKHMRYNEAVKAFRDPVVQYKNIRPKASCAQIQRFLVTHNRYRKISISSIWRILNEKTGTK